MKKVINIITTLLFTSLLLGLVACSGDLHDAEPLNLNTGLDKDGKVVDKTKALQLVGSLFGWGDGGQDDKYIFKPNLKDGKPDGSASVTFTADSTSTDYAIRCGSSWDVAYRGKDQGGSGETNLRNITSDEMGQDIVLWKFNSPTCPKLATKVGAKYTMTVTPGAGDFVTIKIEEVIAENAFLVIEDGKDNSIPLTISGDKQYQLSFWASKNVEEKKVNVVELKEDEKDKEKVTGILYEFPLRVGAFKITYGGLSFGYNGKGDVALGSDIGMSAYPTSSAIEIPNYLEDGKEYVLQFTYKDKDSSVVNVARNTFHTAYIIGDLSKDFAAMTPIIDNCVAYTFKYDAATMTAWGGGAGTLNFKITPKAKWDGELVNIKHTYSVGSGWVTQDDKLEETAGAGNPNVTGLIDGEEYTILLDGTNDVYNLNITMGKPYYFTGDTDATNWDWANFAQIGTSKDKGVYTFAYKCKDKTTAKFKFTGTAGWDDSCNWGGGDKEIKTDGTPAAVITSGGSSDMAVTMTKDKTYTLTLDTNAKTVSCKEGGVAPEAGSGGGGPTIDPATIPNATFTITGIPKTYQDASIIYIWAWGGVKDSAWYQGACDGSRCTFQAPVDITTCIFTTQNATSGTKSAPDWDCKIMKSNNLPIVSNVAAFHGNVDFTITKVSSKYPASGEKLFVWAWSDAVPSAWYSATKSGEIVTFNAPDNIDTCILTSHKGIEDNKTPNNWDSKTIQTANLPIKNNTAEFKE